MHQTFEEYGFSLPDKTPDLLWSDSGDIQHRCFPDKERQATGEPRAWEILARAVQHLLAETHSLPVLIFHLEAEQRQMGI